MKTLRLILTKDNCVYPNHNPNDASDSDLFRRLTDKARITVSEFNYALKPILVDYGIKYTISREGEEKVTDAIIEAVRILEKVCCECDSAYQLRDKAINILKKAIP